MLKVRGLAAVCFCDGLHVLRPTPAGLKLKPPDAAAPDVEDLGLPIRELTCFVGLGEHLVLACRALRHDHRLSVCIVYQLVSKQSTEKTAAPNLRAGERRSCILGTMPIAKPSGRTSRQHAKEIPSPRGASVAGGTPERILDVAGRLVQTRGFNGMS